MEGTVIDQKNKLLQLRYANQPKPENIIWNAQIQALLNHRSVRTYLPDALPEGALETMVAAAQSASTSSNLHQWSVVAITDQELKCQIADLSSKEAGAVGNEYIKQAPVLLLWVADLSRNNAIAKATGGQAMVHDYLDSFVMATIDAALAAQNAGIAAESLGLGIVYIGAMRNQAKELGGLINLPKYSYVAFGMVVGKPDPSRPSGIRPRPVQEVVLHYNHYNAVQSMAQLELYEEAFQGFRAELGLKDKLWKDAAAYTANSSDYMHGREKLRTAIEEQDFKLR